MNNKFINQLEELRKFDSEMQLQTVLTFLYVVKHEMDSEGISIKDLANTLGISSAAASRNVTKLSKATAGNSKGLGLLVAREDPMYRVRKTVHTTALGKRVANDLFKGEE